MKAACFVVVVWAILAAVACHRQAAKQQTTATDGITDGITIDEAQNDVPEFRRVYKVSLSRDITMKVTMYSSRYGDDRYDLSELDQGDEIGKWVLFNMKSPADRILDREILPDVERYCEQIKKLDAEYMASNPAEFVDKNGEHWKRQ